MLDSLELGLGVDSGLGLTDGLGDGDGLGLTLGLGLGDGLCVPPVLQETPPHSSDGDGEGEGEGLGDCNGLGDGLGEAAHEELLTVVLLKVIAAVCAIALPSSVAPPPGKVIDAEDSIVPTILVVPLKVAEESTFQNTLQA